MQTTLPSNPAALTVEPPAPPSLAADAVPAPVQHNTIAPAQSAHPIDPVTAWRIESLKRRQRADSFFNSLSDDESNKLIAWLNDIDCLFDIRTRIVAPPPEGLGRNVSLSSLRRLRANLRAVCVINRTEEMLDNISDLEAASDVTQTSRVQNAIRHLLHQKAYELAMTHPGSEILKDVLASIEKLTTLELKRQKLQLERERLLRCTNTAATPMPTQHHRVDLNIVQPNQAPQREPVQINPPPQPNS